MQSLRCASFADASYFFVFTLSLSPSVQLSLAKISLANSIAYLPRLFLQALGPALAHPGCICIFHIWIRFDKYCTSTVFIVDVCVLLQKMLRMPLFDCPMLVPPRPWLNHIDGGYFMAPCMYLLKFLMLLEIILFGILLLFFFLFEKLGLQK